jgi:hypothetical protein
VQHNKPNDSNGGVLSVKLETCDLVEESTTLAETATMHLTSDPVSWKAFSIALHKRERTASKYFEYMLVWTALYADTLPGVRADGSAP